MKVAQVAPLYESVPPKLYGGTERVVSYLTEELVEQGHDVTLFASGDSVTKAHLISPCERSLRLDPECTDALAYHFLMMEQISKYEGKFDIIHFHTDYLHFHWAQRQSTPHVTTLHGRLDLSHLPPLYREYTDVPVVSISDSQREPLPWLNWRGTVYHGLPRDLYPFQPRPGSYLVFLGRISPEKGVDHAIEISKLAGFDLKIAAKIDRNDREYFESIKHLFDQEHVEFLGEVNEDEKKDLLGNAIALLAPVTWPEPFGMVLIESMACGTPIIAYRRGSIPELIDEGVTGFIVQNVEEALEAVRKVSTLSRSECRRVFEERFDAARMATDYLKVFTELIEVRMDRLARVRTQRKPAWTRSFG